MSLHYDSSPWAPARPRWDPSVSYEPSKLHSYNPHSRPRKSALKRPAHWAFSPHFNESPLRGFPKSHSTIHPFLACSDTPTILWDISTNPERIAPPHLYHWEVFRLLSESATDTPVRSLEIVHKDGLWEANFVVRAGDAPPHFCASRSFVTAGDVLYTLYHQFQKRIDRANYERMCAKFPHLKDGVVAAYWERCQHGRTREGAMEEINQGIRIVDLFMGSLTWVGLTFGRNERELRLHVRPGRPVQGSGGSGGRGQTARTARTNADC
ncbi:hypothetical protein EIP91_003087 [Steccherinum ochraceum]|uniref:DUF6699 domain-containing protein n=1 Tax=Steccherinum ochraceum TaxID=92696 RepID=A0A4R0REG0_9APHY|nr:hypothetical protein EIP91_003087 [Steccherinum ochraceum]